MRAEVPSRIVLVLLALIILPLAALVAFLLRLDSRRRAARTATMHVLGCNRLHSVAMDAGALLPSIAVGWLFAFAGQTGTNHFVAAQVFANHVAFAEDLRAGQRIWWAVLVLLVLALSGSSFVDQDPEVIVARVAGAGGYRLRLRLVIGAVLLTAGVVLVLAIVNSAASSTMQSVGPMLAAVALVLSGQTVALPCIVIGLGRVLAMRHIAGDLARGRLALSRAAWRSPALSLTLLGVIAAIALAALTALDAAADSGATYWDRDRFPADLAIVSATPHGFTSVLPRYTDHIYPLLPAQRAQFLSTQPDHAPTNALFVPCAVLTDIVRVPSETFRPCRQAWVINRSLIRPGHRIVRARPGAVALEVRWGAAVAPTELVDGTESVLIPTRARRLTALLARTRAPQIQGLVRVRSEQQVEMIRDALWNEPGIPLEGISSSPGPIATKHDFIVDGGRYQRAYTPVVTGSLVLASATAVLVVALGAALEVAEASKRNAILVALGTPTSVLRGVLALTTLTPYVLATLLGLLTGAALGGAYLDIGGYRSLDGPLHGFPFGPFAAFGGVELAIVAALAVLGFLVAGRTVRQVDAGSLTSDVA